MTAPVPPGTQVPATGDGGIALRLLSALALSVAGCSHAEEERGPAAVDVNAAAAQGQSDVDNYAAARAAPVQRKIDARPARRGEDAATVYRGSAAEPGAWRM